MENQSPINREVENAVNSPIPSAQPGDLADFIDSNDLPSQYGESSEQVAEDMLEEAREEGFVSDEMADKAFAAAGTTREEVTARIAKIRAVPVEHDDYDEDSAWAVGLLGTILGGDFFDGEDDLEDEDFIDE